MSQPKEIPQMEKIVSLCKRRGFIFQSSEIYGGLNGFWDYGPLGVELKRNVKESWWRDMVTGHDDLGTLPGAPSPLLATTRQVPCETQVRGSMSPTSADPLIHIESLTSWMLPGLSVAWPAIAWPLIGSLSQQLRTWAIVSPLSVAGVPSQPHHLR